MSSTRSFYKRMQGYEIGGHTPFATAPIDMGTRLMSHAHALSTLIAIAERDASEAHDAGRDSEFGNLRSSIKSEAHEGVAALVALADFFNQEADGDWRVAD